MTSPRVVFVLAVLVVACTASSVSTPSSPPPATVAGTTTPTTASPAAAPTAARSRASAPTTPGTFAAVCGTTSDFVGDSVQTNGSFVLNAPGRDPLKITIPAGRLGGRASGYVCIEILAGVPYPLFDGFFASGTAGFVNAGTVPATTASPAPVGFVLPQACAYVAPPVVGTDQTDWWVDCGAASNNARGTLGQALAQQGWTSCGAGLATAHWQKNDVMLGVAESSLAPGDHPRVTQSRLMSPCK